AELRIGQYTIGGNPTPPGTTPSGLIKEIQNAMNYAVNGTYNDSSTTPFAVRLVSQYPELGSDGYSPESFDTNCAQFNRIKIINVNQDHWELLWLYGPNHRLNASNLLGFNNIDYIEPTVIIQVTNGSGILIPAG